MKKIFFIFTILLLTVMTLTASHGRAYDEIHPQITILTLDNRPANNLFLKQMSAIAGVELIIEFGTAVSTSADCVSLNAAACGSLVESRTSNPWALEPPNINPDALIHFAVPRVQPTVTDPLIAAEYIRVMESLADPIIQNIVVESLNDDSYIIHDTYLADYSNRISGWLDFLERGQYDPDRLLISLDDNRAGPLSDTIKIRFGEYSHYVYDGTDEGMMLLVARKLGELRERMPSTCPVVFTDSLDNVFHFTGFSRQSKAGTFERFECPVNLIA